ncbi:MAG: heavy metal-binding domain-containing protein [Streptosporangiaceae bacterium]|nr:heavy metal-binding domain-containing protein [Streptosporangiaceae bacterium]
MREELPAVVRERMAEIWPAGTWGSALTSDEFAVIRSVGFEPVGQVFGAAVYGAGSASGSSCPGTTGSSGDATQGRPVISVSGQGGLGSFGPLVQAMNQARHTAINRMTAECAALGGHGVVGVRLSRGSFVLGGLEFNAIGTAVRAPGAAHGPRAPFTSGLSGQDFAKLIMTGWVPAGLVLGISIGSRHDDRVTTRQTRWRAGNAEVAGWTELVVQSRRDARGQLESDVRRLGAEGVVIATMQMRVRERECPVQLGRHDHIVEATLIGTAIARFSPARQPGGGPALAIMPLDPQRRQAARIRI